MKLFKEKTPEQKRQRTLARKARRANLKRMAFSFGGGILATLAVENRAAIQQTAHDFRVHGGEFISAFTSIGSRNYQIGDEARVGTEIARLSKYGAAWEAALQPSPAAKPVVVAKPAAKTAKPKPAGPVAAKRPPANGPCEQNGARCATRAEIERRQREQIGASFRQSAQPS